MEMPATTGTAVDVPPLRTSTKIFYGSGQAVDAIAATMLPTFLFFYLTAVCGISGFLAGLTMLITLVIDAIADPFIGALSDNTRSRWGRRHLFMFVSLVPLAIALGLLFSIPPWMTEVQAFVSVTAISLVMRLCYSAYTLPHAALGAELTQDYVERSTVVSFRLFFNALAAFVPVVLGYSIFLAGPNGVLDRASYIPFAWTCAAILFAVGLFSALTTFPLRHQLFVAPVLHLSLGRTLLRDVGDIARNRSAQILFGVVLAFNIAQGIVLNLNLHANKYFWGLSPKGLEWLGLSHPFGMVLGIPVGIWLSRRFEKKPIVAWGLTTMCVLQATFPLMRIAGLIPSGEAGTLAILLPGHVLMFCAYMALLISFTSMIADAADEHELKYGGRREALFFAGVAFATKSAAGFGALWAGMVLGLIGFPKDLARQAVTPEVATKLGLAAGPIAAVITLSCVALILRYRIDRTRHAEILAELEARRIALEVG